MLRTRPVIVPFHNAIPTDALARTLQKLMGDNPGTGRIHLVIEKDLIGPGGELMKILHRLGFRVTPGCKCRARAAVMDANGCDWCEQNIDTIVGWLREEAQNRHLPFVDAAGRMLVRRAIANARRQDNGQ